MCGIAVGVIERVAERDELRLERCPRPGELGARLLDSRGRVGVLAQPPSLRVDAILHLPQHRQRRTPGGHVGVLEAAAQRPGVTAGDLASGDLLGPGEELIQARGGDGASVLAAPIRQCVVALGGHVGANSAAVLHQLRSVQRQLHVASSAGDSHRQCALGLLDDHGAVHVQPLHLRASEPGHDRALGVRLAESPVLHRTAHVLGAERGRSGAAVRLYPGALEHGFELLPGRCPCGCLVDLGLQQSLVARAADRHVEVAERLRAGPLRLRHDGEVLLHAELVADLADAAHRVSLAPELATGLHVDGVEDDVVVDVSLVQVRGDHVLVFAARDPLGKLLADAVRGLSIDRLCGIERLDHVVCEHAAVTGLGLANALRGLPHRLRDRGMVRRINHGGIRGHKQAIHRCVVADDVLDRLGRSGLDLPHLHVGHQRCPRFTCSVRTFCTSRMMSRAERMSSTIVSLFVFTFRAI